jgi:hypothetical protein
MPNTPIKDLTLDNIAAAIKRLEDRYTQLTSVEFLVKYNSNSLPTSIAEEDAVEWYELLASMNEILSHQNYLNAIQRRYSETSENIAPAVPQTPANEIQLAA